MIPEPRDSGMAGDDCEKVARVSIGYVRKKGNNREKERIVRGSEATCTTNTPLARTIRPTLAGVSRDYIKKNK